MARTLNNEVDVLNIASLDNDIKDSFTRAMISEDVNTTSAAARKYLKGEYFIHNDRCLYKALEEIAAGTTITPDVNAELVTVSEELVRLFAQSPEGIFEVISNVQNGDSATRSFVEGEQIIWKDKQLYKVTADVVSGGTWVVGTNIDLADNLTSQIKTLANNDDAILNVLGAKNLLPNNAASQTVNGITFTVNTDPNSDAYGSVRAQGTVTSGHDYARLVLSTDVNIKDGKYKLTGCPQGLNGGYLRIITLDSSLYYQDFGDGTEFELLTDAVYTFDIVILSADGTVDVTFYPMIRPASVVDDTYAPYAMTNRELTELTDSTLKLSEIGTAIIHCGSTVWGAALLFATTTINFTKTYTEIPIVVLKIRTSQPGANLISVGNVTLTTATIGMMRFGSENDVIVDYYVLKR